MAVPPGRFQVVNWQGRTIILDPAHTPAAAAALRRDVLALGHSKPVWIVAMLRGRAPAPFLSGLASSDEDLLVTQTESSRSVETALLQHEAGPRPHVVPFSSPVSALEWAVDATPMDSPIVITGSVELVARMREALQVVY